MTTAARRAFVSLVLPLFILQAAHAQLGGMAGSYSRMGLGARGIGMGNALTAVFTGDVVGYYNPAAVALSRSRTISASFGILALDRKLNSLSFTQPLKPTAGLSAGIINSGVSNIDGRDDDGEPTGMLHNTENQVFLAFANRFSGKLSLGINIKLLYHHLYTDVSTTTVGVDLGAIFQPLDNLTFGATVKDINSRYKWDTSELYSDQPGLGRTTIDKFPLLYTFGVAYQLPDSLGVIASDIELSNQSTVTGRLGVEVDLLPELTVRAGLDRMDLKQKGNGVSPSFGFTLRRNLDDWTPAIHYSFVAEPFAPTGMHTIALSTTF